MRWLIVLAAAVIAFSALADEKPAGLTPKQIADGWIMLFDGETTFGWKIDGESKVENGKLILGGEKATTARVTSEFRFYIVDVVITDTVGKPKYSIAGGNFGGSGDLTFEENSVGGDVPTSPFSVVVPAGSKLAISKLRIRPESLEPLFNGKDLTGWKQYKGDNKRDKSKFTVTPEGWLSLKNGPGDLQTEKQFDDFVLQLDCITNGKNLNSGVFFRCIPGDYQNGYEAQIHNGFKNNDRTKPSDYGTGAIYRRQPARKVVSNDNEWFTMTVLAHGKHIATWVNGYQVTDFTDPRPPRDNPREGSKIGPGAISLQGHDPTTDLNFRNIRIAELKK